MIDLLIERENVYIERLLMVIYIYIYIYICFQLKCSYGIALSKYFREVGILLDDSNTEYISVAVILSNIMVLYMI